MASDLGSILKLEVPLIVVLAQRAMSVSEVVGLVPGSIIELPKQAEEELELHVNNKAIGTGRAVKVGENFGIRLSFIGDLRERIEALGAGVPSGPAADATDPDAALAEQMIAGQAA